MQIVGNHTNLHTNKEKLFCFSQNSPCPILTITWSLIPYYTQMCVLLIHTYYLIQNSQAAKKECGLQKGYCEKRCEIQGGSQEMVVMVG